VESSKFTPKGISATTRLILAVMSVACGIAFAQGDRGTITGTVQDPAGAVVAGASVEAKNSQTGGAYSAATTGTGNFTLAQLPAGTYEVNVSSAGFKNTSARILPSRQLKPCASM
jgi:type V secretory pathway adhesin AidA